MNIRSRLTDLEQVKSNTIKPAYRRNGPVHAGVRAFVHRRFCLHYRRVLLFEPGPIVHQNRVLRVPGFLGRVPPGEYD